MDPDVLLLVAACLFAYALVARRIGSWGFTGALVFTAVGMLLGDHGIGWVTVQVSHEAVARLVELTLTLVLFADASRIDLGALRRDAAFPGRLLGIGLPLTIVAGVVLARVLFPDLDAGLVLLAGIMLAPTDASLGQAVVTDPRVPVRVRQGLNVESGLNDGICMPFFTVALALAAEETDGGSGLLSEAARQLGWGLVLGVAVGIAAALALRWARRQGLTDGPGAQLAVLMVPLLAYGATVALGGSGFIGSFVAGLAFGTTLRRTRAGEAAPDDAVRAADDEAFELNEDVGQLLTVLTYFVFGGLAADVLLPGGLLPLVYAVLSLTLVRMAPVALALLGSRARPPTVLYAGWFGPRGLASVLLLVLTLEAVPDAAGIETLAAAVGWTVLLSIVLHGLSAPPLTTRYAAWYAAHPDRGDLVESAPVHEHRLRLPRQGRRPR